MHSDNGAPALKIKPGLSIPLSEVEWHAIRAQGAGGQNVNKVASAVHLRFDVRASSLPQFYKDRLLAHADSRIGGDGVVVIKAQSHRTQSRNHADALERLCELLRTAAAVDKPRRPTRPSRGAKERRLKAKNVRARLKSTRGRVTSDD